MQMLTACRDRSLLIVSLWFLALPVFADEGARGCKLDERGIWLCPPAFFANQVRPGCRVDEDSSAMTGQCFEQTRHADDARLNQVYQELLHELRKRGEQRKCLILVPADRIERTTYRLQGGCSTN